MHQYMILLSDLSYEAGLIGLAEYEERQAIAYWLSPFGKSVADPRGAEIEGREHSDEPSQKEMTDKGFSPNGGNGGNGGAADDGRDPGDRWPRFLAFNRWLFTVGDRDCYPSVPHGHLHRKTNEWPKLNPYTGRVFSDVHVESIGSRLTKPEMKQLWGDEDFVDHCRKQVLWYSDFAKDYGFPRARFGKLRFPRWR